MGQDSSPVVLVVGLFLVYVAVVLLGWVVFKNSAHIPLARRRPDAIVQSSGLSRLTDHAVGALNKSVRERGNRFLSRDRLDECGLKKDPGDYLLMGGVATLLAGVIGYFLGGLAPAFLLTLLTPVLLHIVLNVLGARRRHQFDDQVPDTLQMLAGGLRAGHSLLRAVDAAAQESQPPMSEELSRILNETRIGRDLGESLSDVARRTQSEDFAAIAQAIEIHREVGGDLAEVLDHLGDTVRDRNQVRGQIRALSAEGKMSALVLMSLPVLMFLGLTTLNALYAKVFYTTFPGYAMIAAGLVLLTLGGLWLKSLVKPKF